MVKTQLLLDCVVNLYYEGIVWRQLELAFFGARLRLRTFLYADGGYMSKNKKTVIDITGVELAPGEPTVCLGNGEGDFECCCDECDYYLSCFSELAPGNKEKILFDNKGYK